MKKESIYWNELIKLTQGEAFEVERIRIKRTGVKIEGSFELPRLVQMSDDDQVFVSAFLRSHGSIKEMERLFGISYPSVKARLNRIAEQLPFVESLETSPSPEGGFILDQLAEGKINAIEAAKLLRKRGES